MPGRNGSPFERRAMRLSRSSCLTDFGRYPLWRSSRTVEGLFIAAHDARRAAPKSITDGRRVSRMKRLVVALVLLLAVPALASDVGFSGTEGHPRARLPLALHMTSFGDAALDAAATKAVDDWNRVAQLALGVPVFARTDARDAAQIAVETLPP